MHLISRGWGFAFESSMIRRPGRLAALWSLSLYNTLKSVSAHDVLLHLFFFSLLFLFVFRITGGSTVMMDFCSGF